MWDALEVSHKKKFLREMEDGLEKERNLVSAGGESLPFRYKLLKIVLLHGFIREIFERQKPSVSQLLQSACLRGFPLLGKDTEGNSPIGLIP